MAALLRWRMLRWRLTAAEISLHLGQDAVPASIMGPKAAAAVPKHAALALCTACPPLPPAAGLPEAVFAAAVPNNYGRPLLELVQGGCGVGGGSAGVPLADAAARTVAPSCPLSFMQPPAHQQTPPNPCVMCCIFAAAAEVFADHQAMKLKRQQQQAAQQQE